MGDMPTIPAHGLRDRTDGSSKFLVVDEMKAKYDLHAVRRWRSEHERLRHGASTSTTVRSSTGSNPPSRKHPSSLSIFLHEVGHHAIGFDRYRKRCEEDITPGSGPSA